MSNISTSRNRNRFAWLVVAAAAAAGGALASLRAAPSSPDALEPLPGVFVYESDGFRYSYHAPTGTETLIDARGPVAARHNVMAQHVEVARKMRRALEQKLKVKSLDELRADYADTIRRLHSIGYW